MRTPLFTRTALLVLEYADVYPAVPEAKAAKLLKDYLALEKELTSARAGYLKRFGKVLPASKVLRFAQVENRLDLALRLRLASAIPLLPGPGKLTMRMLWVVYLVFALALYLLPPRVP